MNNEEFGELDYILQVISNKIRRDVIKVLAEKGELTYTDLMKEVGIEDSGTFGFHLRKMRRMLDKNDIGQYKLNDLGRKAYEIIKNLEGKYPEEEREEVREVETMVITDRLRFDLTRDLIETLHREGKKLILKDIITLNIHPMPRELFDKVVEELSDCLVINAPKELIDLVEFKAKNSLSVKGYTGKPPRIGGLSNLIPGVGKILSTVFSDIVTPILESISKLPNELISRKIERELSFEQDIEIPKASMLNIDLSGGEVKVLEGDKCRIRVWKFKGREPDVDFNIDTSKKIVNLTVSNGSCELILSKNLISNLNVDVNGGILNVNLSNLEGLNIELSGGLADLKLNSNNAFDARFGVNGGIIRSKLNISEHSGSSNIEVKVNGGSLKIDVNIPIDVKVKSKARSFGGLLNIKLNGKSIPGNYTEENFDESKSKLYIYSELIGGIASLNINKLNHQ